MSKVCPGILIGDPKVGKSSLLEALSYGPPLTYYCPSVPWHFDSQAAEIFILNRHRMEEAYFPINRDHSKTNDIESVVVHDIQMPGFHVQDLSRHFVYGQGDFFLLCFDISEETSLRNVVEKWHPELLFRSPTKSFILVGCKSDLRPPLQPDANCSEVNDTNGKIVFVGDSQVGKTSLLYTIHNGRRPTFEELRSFPCYSISLTLPNTLPNPPSFFDTDHVPPTFDTWMPRTASSVSLVDTIGAEDYGHLRPYSYRESLLIAVCFSVGTRKSLRNVLDRWHPELLLFAPDTPILLVGCKSDTRASTTTTTIHRGKDEIEGPDGEAVDCVSVEEGRAMARRINAIGYLECSTRQGVNIEEVKSTLNWCSIALQNDASTDRSQGGCIIA